jgi:hypothetical protein
MLNKLGDTSRRNDKFIKCSNLRHKVEIKIQERGTETCSFKGGWHPNAAESLFLLYTQATDGVWNTTSTFTAVAGRKEVWKMIERGSEQIHSGCQRRSWDQRALISNRSVAKGVIRCKKTHHGNQKHS